MYMYVYMYKCALGYADVHVDMHGYVCVIDSLSVHYAVHRNMIPVTLSGSF